MSIIARQCSGEADYERMRQLVIAAISLGDERHHATLGDLDWWRFTSNDLDPLASVRLWLDGDAAIGVAWPSGDQVDLIAHPQHSEVEDAMLDWAEARHRDRHAGASDPPPLTTYAHDGDDARVARLRRRGYERTDDSLIYRRRPLDGPLPEPVLPPGYTLRHVAGESDLEARVNAHRAAFAPSRMTVAKHRAVMAAPTYRPDLDIIAVAPDGRIAAYCLVWFDAANRMAIFEPVGTDPDFQRRGLGKAVLSEGFRRLRALGARVAYVNSADDNPASNALYEAVGFRLVDENHAWTKAL